ALADLQHQRQALGGVEASPAHGVPADDVPQVVYEAGAHLAVRDLSFHRGRKTPTPAVDLPRGGELIQPGRQLKDGLPAPAAEKVLRAYHRCHGWGVTVQLSEEGAKGH